MAQRRGGFSQNRDRRADPSEGRRLPGRRMALRLIKAPAKPDSELIYYTIKSEKKQQKYP